MHSYLIVYLTDGLEDLEVLQLLNLSGNYLHNVAEFKKLTDAKDLNQLKLIDKKNNTTNPICTSNPNYIQDIHQILPQVEIIDGNFETNLIV